MLGDARRCRSRRSKLGLLRVRVRPKVVRHRRAARTDIDARGWSAAEVRVSESSATHVPSPAIADRGFTSRRLRQRFDDGVPCKRGCASRDHHATGPARLSRHPGHGRTGVPSAARPPHAQSDSDSSIGACRCGGSALAGEITNESGGTDAIKHLIAVGTSAGGARAKAVVALNPITNELRSGQVPADPGFEHWLLKLDGVSPDLDLGVSGNFGRIEYAYSKMAAVAASR